MTVGQAKHVIIVGGGASGVLLACHLLRDGNTNIRVTLIEKRPTVGRGTAYSTAQAGPPPQRARRQYERVRRRPAAFLPLAGQER